MLTAVRARQEVDEYRHRVDALYDDLRDWIADHVSGAVFNQSSVQLDEEATGPYTADSLDVNLPGLPAVRFVPRGIFMVGARGRIDVRSRLGRQTIVWIDAGGPALTATVEPGEETEMIASRPVFANAVAGWCWENEKRVEWWPICADVLWDRILTPLTR